MAGNLSYNLFALAPEAATNDTMRVGGLLFEYIETNITIASNEGTVEVSTSLGEVIGLTDLSYISSAADPTQSIKLITDGVITSGAVTVNAKSEAVTDGTITVRFFLVGRKTNSTI